LIHKTTEYTGSNGRILSITIDEGAGFIEIALTKNGAANKGARVRIEKGKFDACEMASLPDEIEKAVDIIFGEIEGE